ncbi:hypothetical protein GLOIN_2v1781861 [Rhizophagus irregularis DAOM 181602=DAOM 197198]|nr:hypothetical protein GLOIN_2v1781861 [Rhizophagus irregularis DAOM 181602=DAOM 197198]CAG8704766.1 6503_t:CDS:2 [Rhizophagus irregularis]
MKKNAGNLKLWKISIPYDRDDEIQKFSLQENDELLAIMDIGDYWKVEEITKKHIHVFVSDKLTHENIKVYQIIEELKNLQIRFAQREWTSWKRFFVTLIGMKICIIVI